MSQNPEKQKIPMDIFFFGDWIGYNLVSLEQWSFKMF